MGEAAGHLLPCAWQVIAIDALGGRLTGHLRRVNTAQPIRAYGAGREHLPRPRRLEARQEPAHMIIVKDLRSEVPAPEQGHVVVGEARFQALQGTPATQGLPHHPAHHGARIDLHLRRHQLIADLHSADLVCIGVHKGQMGDLVDLNLVRYATHPLALETLFARHLLKIDDHSRRLHAPCVKIQLGNIGLLKPEGCGM